jgi:arylsulfatase A-like enzyme
MLGALSMKTHVSLLLLAASFGCGKASDSETAPAAPTAQPTTATAPAGAPPKAPTKAASRGAERSVYSLVDNRLSAHLTRNGGLLLPGGSAGFAKYVRFSNQIKEGTRKSWELRQTDGGIKVAKMTGKMASVFVPLTKEQAKNGTVRVRINAKSEGTFSLQINDNEKKPINGKVTKGWQTVTLEAASQLQEGENAIQLFTKSSDATVAWIQIGGAEAVGDDGSAAFFDAGSKALSIPQRGAMSYFVMMPEKGRLTGDLSDGNCTINVTALADDGATASGKLSGLGSAVDFAALGGKGVRLDLETTGCERALLSNAGLVVPGEIPVAKRGDAPKHVLFIIMDSLRADRVKPFNPKARPEVPNWDKLAESSAVFLNHYVQGTESQVSHASMWTSMYLAKHRASQMSDKLPAKWMTIDEVAKKAGKFTAGVSANGYIRPARGFGDGWDKYINHIEKGGGLKAVDIIDRGIGYLKDHKDKPWFLYMGFIDTHVTWRGKSPWIEKYDGGYKGRFEKEFGDEPNGFPKDVTDREKDHVRAIYDSNVSYQDDQLGKLIEKLKAWGVWDQTMLIITADHGDELWEDGKTVGHARMPKQTIVNVPMLIHYPAMFPTGKFTSGTEGIDIVPTIADALGVALDPEWQGSSMLPVATGAQPYPHLAVASQYENFHAGKLGNWKLKLAGTGAPTLYNLAKDPNERNDLWMKSGSTVGARLLLDPMWMLRQWNVEWKKSSWGNPAAVTPRFATDLGE